VTALIPAELGKLWHTRSTRLLVGVAAVVVGAAVALELAAARPETAAQARTAMSWMGSGGLVTLMLGVLVGGAAFRHRTIVTASLVAPRRARLVLAEAAAVAVLALAASAISIAVTVLEVYGWIVLSGAGGPLEPGAIARPAAGTVAYTTLSALLGYGLAVVARSQIAAAVACLVVLAAVEPGLAAAAPTAGRFGPTALGIAITGGGGDGGPFQRLLPAPAAVALYAAAAGAVLLAAAWRTARRDVP
jgi:hypothetical protein